MYSRDKRSPTPKNAAVSRVMSANRAKNSTPELTLRKALWKSGLRGYRLHRRIRISSSPPYQGGVAASRGRGGSLSAVRPDISFVSKKLAIFVHGCFWHRCPKCSYKLPKTNSAFWQATVVGLPQHWRALTPEFDRNVARDARKAEDLRNIGWIVLTVELWIDD